MAEVNKHLKNKIYVDGKNLYLKRVMQGTPGLIDHTNLQILHHLFDTQGCFTLNEK